MHPMDLETFTSHVEQELQEAFGLAQLAVDGDGDWQFSIEAGPVWVRVLADPDLHVHLFCRVAEAVTEEALAEVNRLNAIMTAGALVLTDDSTIIAMMRLHRSMTNRESLRLVIDAMGSYMRDLGPMFEVIHGGGKPLPPPTTPERIDSLAEGHVFVFGSNAGGTHGGGAAKVARRLFGAISGVGEGLRGQSYAVPTMEGPEAFEAASARFVVFAEGHPELTFWLTRVGCGIAGYSDDDLKEWFAAAPSNVIRPPGW